MKELKIGDFNHDDNLSSASPHHEEINTLKIDKLSNRVTIISVIIPCIIGAIIIFGYLGMQETVIDVNNEKQSKIIEISKQFEAKSNALDVKLANIQALLDKKLPEIEKKMKKLDASLAKLSSKKADKASVKKDIGKLNWRYKTQIDTISKTSQSNKTLINDSMSKFQTELVDMGKEVEEKTIKVEEYETTVATTLKNLSILKKRYDEFKKESLTKNTFDSKLNKMEKSFNTKLKSIEQKMIKLSTQSQPAPVQKQPADPSKKTIVEEPIED